MQAILDLGYGEQGRDQSDTREVGRGLYPKDNEEPWRNFKKEEMWQLYGQTLWQIYAGLGGREVLEETGGREAG